MGETCAVTYNLDLEHVKIQNLDEGSGQDMPRSKILVKALGKFPENPNILPNEPIRQIMDIG